MLLPETLDRFLAATAPDHDPIQTEMVALAEEDDFPIIGPSAGAVLRGLASARQASRVFEFGSGFGYSATWFLEGMDPDGEIVLTEIDPAELALAEEFLTDRGVSDRVTFEEGDALEIVEDYDGPFDCVLIDHDKERYPEAFEAIRSKLVPGGVVIADNILAGPVSYEDILDAVENEHVTPEDPTERGLVEYLRTVDSATGFDTAVLPTGSGLAVTTRRPSGGR